MTRTSSRVLGLGAALALAVVPGAYAATSAFAAGDAAAPAAPAFTLTQTASGFDVTLLGTGATLSFTVGSDGEVDAVDSEADEPAVALPPAPVTAPVTAPVSQPATAGDTSDAADANDATDDNGNDAADAQNANDQGDNNDQQGPDDQSGDQQGPNDQSGDHGSSDGGSND